MSKRYALSIKKFLSDRECDQLQETLTKYHKENPRDTTLIWFLAQTGARCTEAILVKWEDFDADTSTVHITGIKGSDDRNIPIPKWLFERIMALPRESGRPFNISYKRLNQIWNLYRPVKKKTHSLRHTFAQKLYEKTKDIRLVKYTLGHRSIANTMIYVEFHENQASLKNKMVDWGNPLSA
jgi:integrase/recombinase XerC